jgi:hypothetical protein
MIVGIMVTKMINLAKSSFLIILTLALLSVCRGNAHSYLSHDEKYPEKTPSIAVIMSKRIYDENSAKYVCFKSIPGDHVFGNLNKPPNALKGKDAVHLEMKKLQ